MEADIGEARGGIGEVEEAAGEVGGDDKGGR